MVSVRLGEALENQLNFLSHEKHIPKSKIIKDSLIYYFDMISKESKQKSPYELGADLFGKYSSDKGTLSTTYKQQLKEKINAKNSHR